MVWWDNELLLFVGAAPVFVFDLVMEVSGGSEVDAEAASTVLCIPAINAACAKMSLTALEIGLGAGFLM